MKTSPVQETTALVKIRGLRDMAKLKAKCE
jgi:hypothetical protein